MLTQHFKPNIPAKFYGLSTDTKPTDCANGSKFFEIDTGKAYRFDEENSQWREFETTVKPSDLADKATYDYVNNAVSTNTAYFIGTFASRSDMEAYPGAVSNNDYAFVETEYVLLTTQPADWATNYTSYYTKSVVAPTWETDKYYSKSGDTYTLTTSEPSGWATNYASYYTLFNVTEYHSVVGVDTYAAVTGGSAPAFALNTYYQGGNDLYDRYKYNSDTDAWTYEYSLNNSNFTPAQFAAINSGMTASDKTKLDTVQTGANKTEFDTVPTQDSGKAVTSGGLFTLFAPKTQDQYDALVSKTEPIYFIYET